MNYTESIDKTVMQKSKLGIIFDLDGTLWDSTDGVAKAWSKVVAEKYSVDRIITATEMRSVMGLTMDKIASTLFPKLGEHERTSLLEACCNEENNYLLKSGGILYPKLEETLKQLKEKYSLFIVSNCQSGYIEAFMKHYGFERYFEDIECYGNNGLNKCENIRKVVERNTLTDAVYVGDIQGDHDAAVDAEVKFIHAAYGFGTVKQPVPFISSFSELPQAVNEIFA